MSSIFRKDDNIKNHPKRNVFDLSFQNNLTLKMGHLYPVFKKVVYPGDSLKIDPSFGLRYLPQVFPVQTRQRASLKFYYVRNRNLWKDWPDFIGKTKNGLVPPYLHFHDTANRLLRPSGLADYLGLPIHVKPTKKGRQFLKAAQPNFVRGNDYAFIPNSDTTLSNDKGDPFSILTRKYIGTKFGLPTDNETDIVPMTWLYGGASTGSAVAMPEYLDNSLGIGAYYRPTTWNTEQIYLGLYRKPLIPMNGEFEVNFNYDAYGMAVFAILRDTTGVDYLRPLRNEQGNNIVNISTPVSVKTLVTLEGTTTPRVESISVQLQSVVGYVAIDRYAQGIEVPELPSFEMSISLAENTDVCWCDVAYEDWPFANEVKPDGLRLSALYPRAIEAVYNALIRHPENNPFMIDGQPEYNKYNVSTDGGPCNTFKLLEHYQCNWADDRFTTALPSPQQGNAPLVGLTGTTGATFVIGNEDGSQQRIKLSVDIETGDVVGVLDGSSASPDLVSEIWNAVDYGISINDIRNVNSYQRWKEVNMRGLKYKDQISNHYGVSVRYDVLDMPEFIGGVSRDVNVSQITQTVENEYGNLGDYGGQSYIMGNGHSIEHYCDEHGFVIGMLCVYPMPLYQDTLSKDWLINDALDYYFPEFGKIGPQPITNKELAFSQSVLEGNENDTFGYQRAWYDMLESLDEIHGLFQSDFRNYLIGRDFLQVPTLGSDFLTIDPEDINNTFYTDDDKDKILGQLYFDFSMKRPVPLTGIPSIE